MPVFKEMDQELAMRLIEGHKDVLTPELERLESLYKTFSCPRCKCSLQKEFDAKHVFADQAVMNGRALLRCSNCRYLIDPHSNLIIEYGDPSKIPVERMSPLDPES